MDHRLWRRVRIERLRGRPRAWSTCCPKTIGYGTSRRSHHGPVATSAGNLLCENGGRPGEANIIDGDIELLIVEGDRPSDGADLAQRVVVGPGDVRMHSIADSGAPVPRCDPLVRADTLGFTRLQV